MTTGPLELVAVIAQALGALTPAEHPLRHEVEQRLRTRQREDGSFGDLVDTAHALQSLVALGHTDVQAERAARSIVEQLRHATADELDGQTGETARAVERGLGLSPAGFDPSAGPREAALALHAYAAAGGR